MSTRRDSDTQHHHRQHQHEQRPLAVICGWLGSKPKSLQRYKNIYEQNLNYSTIVRIAPASLVVLSATSFSSNANQHHHHHHHQKENDDAINTGNVPENEKMITMKDLAMDILKEIHSKNCSTFLFHVFSNGGCFVWEEVRNLLFFPQRSMETKKMIHDSIISTLRDKLIGVVFDSCPAQYEARLMYRALEFASPSNATAFTTPTKATTTKIDESIVNKRANQFWQSMKNDSTEIPQLYLYSDVDELAPFQPLHELVRCRKRRREKTMMTYAHLFHGSSHCRHLVMYPKQYLNALKDFLEICMDRYENKNFGHRDVVAVVVPKSRL